MKTHLLTSTALIALILGANATAQEAAPAILGEDPERVENAPPEQVVLLEVMDFRRWPDDAFFETKLDLVEAMSSSHSDERGAVMLDVAELYLSQMLSVEAESFVQAAKDTGWALSPRYVALSDAVNLMKGVAVDDPETSPLFMATRLDRGLWIALNGIAEGDAVAIQNNLAGALIGLA